MTKTQFHEKKVLKNKSRTKKIEASFFTSISQLSFAIRFILPAFLFNVFFCISYLLIFEYELNKIIVITFVFFSYIVYLIYNLFYIRSRPLVEKLIHFSSFVVLSSPAIIYTIILTASFLPNFFQKVGSIDAWIMFAGSLLGGSMTMFALFFTISYESDTRRIQSEQLEISRQLSWLPFIEGTINYVCDSPNKVNNDQPLLIRNLSNNPLRSLRLVDYQLKIKYPRGTISDSIKISFEEKGILYQGQEYAPKIFFDFDDLSLDEGIVFNVILNISFWDYARAKEYEHVLHLQFIADYLLNENFENRYSIQIAELENK